MSSSPAPSSWTGVPDDDPFGVDHLPYGSAVVSGGRRVAVVRIGDRMLDLTSASDGGEFAMLFADGSLDTFLAAGRRTWTVVRAAITAWLTDDTQQDRLAPLLSPVADARLVLPFQVADYVDFYASENHVVNVGRMFRPGTPPLYPNWKHGPVGYHGRAGTVLVSGTPIRRPNGQFRGPSDTPLFGPSQRLDIEAEVAFVVGTGSDLGTAVALDRFREHVFGLCLLNDWSARDVQAWEYVPLGPFLGKSFATSVAAWITPLDALDAAWTTPPPRDEPLLPYLDDAGRSDALDIDLEIRINGQLVARPPFAGMYWTPAQMLAHMTVNGAALRTGDLYASGTVSGPNSSERGSLLELTWNGSEPLTLGSELRTFLQDGDEVQISASAPGRNGRIGLGAVMGRITKG